MSTLLTITAHSIDELEWKTNEIKTYLIGQGLKLKLCWFMQEEAFKMSLPVCQFNSQIFKNSKRNLLSSSLAAAAILLLHMKLMMKMAFYTELTRLIILSLY